MSENEVSGSRPSVSKLIKAECSKCQGIRNCDVRGQHNQTQSDGGVDWWTTWRILECRGCENVFVQTISGCSEDYQYEDDGTIVHNETIYYWPALSKRKPPEWMPPYGMDAENVDRLDRAMSEVYGALDNGMNMLAAIGIRTSFDIAAELLGIDPDLTFQKKLRELVLKGLIGTVDEDRLYILVEAGNASAHRGWRPQPDDLKTVMDVLEHFVHEAFVAPYRKKKLEAEAAKVKTSVPPRKPKQRERPKSTEKNA